VRIPIAGAKQLLLDKLDEPWTPRGE
jgi:hypothetical protein